MSLTKRPTSKRMTQNGGSVGPVLPVECPICRQVFTNGTTGWHSHIAPLRKHPHWHPDTPDGSQRIELFKEEFPEFFGQAKTPGRRMPPPAPLPTPPPAPGVSHEQGKCPTCGAPVEVKIMTTYRPLTEVVKRSR